jgi:diguanylate cyclase
VRPRRKSRNSQHRFGSRTFNRFTRSVGRILFSGPADIPLPVYREFVGMLYSMRLPIVGLGVVFVAVCIIAGFKHGDLAFAALGILGSLTTILRVVVLISYQKVSPVCEFEDLKYWEQRYAIGNYASAALIALLNVTALSLDDSVLHLMAVSLVFSFGAGVVSRIAVRPQICVLSLLLATVPTVAALAIHAFDTPVSTLYTEMLLMEATLVALITCLSLQTVTYLFSSALEYHTARHDLAQLAKFDSLTGLANRLMLRERFEKSMESLTDDGNLVALHFLDLDGFKAVNDKYGHPIGDDLLKQVAQRLQAILRADDTVARLGGDEFIVLQTDLQHKDEAKILARRIIKQLSAPYTIDGATLYVSASVGIATAREQGTQLERLLSCADTALYQAKAGGKARAILCNESNRADLSGLSKSVNYPRAWA